jgi:hypothetical protein
LEAKFIKGAILNAGEEFYSNLKKVFKAINNKQSCYNWLITDCECYPQNHEYAEKLSKDYCWISGDELTHMVEEDDFQWIWAVLSGFNKNISFDDVLKYKFPYADGNQTTWKNPIDLQHPLASVEIIAWDSTSTVIIGKEDGLVDQFLEYFKLAKDLEKYNIGTEES